MDASVFQVKHSRTSSQSSYRKDFHELIKMYMRKAKAREKKEIQEFNGASVSISEIDAISENDSTDVEDGDSDRDDEMYSMKENGSKISKGKEMSIEYLENEVDVFQSVDDWDGIEAQKC